MHNTLVYESSIEKGLQWVIYNARDKHGPLRALVNTNFERMVLWSTLVEAVNSHINLQNGVQSIIPYSSGTN